MALPLIISILVVAAVAASLIYFDPLDAGSIDSYDADTDWLSDTSHHDEDDSTSVGNIVEQQWHEDPAYSEIPGNYYHFETIDDDTSSDDDWASSCFDDDISCGIDDWD